MTKNKTQNKNARKVTFSVATSQKSTRAAMIGSSDNHHNKAIKCVNFSMCAQMQPTIQEERESEGGERVHHRNTPSFRPSTTHRNGIKKSLISFQQLASIAAALSARTHADTVGL